MTSTATFFFPEESPNHLEEDEIIEILDEAKAPKWHEVIMVAAIIDIFQVTYEEPQGNLKRH